jgi:large subunit ribosomal protein L34e
MPRPHERTRSRKRVNKTAPSGKKVNRYKQKISATAHCGLCGQPLAGIAHLTPLKASKLSRSKRRVWRPYGGQLCHECLKLNLRQIARKA